MKSSWRKLRSVLTSLITISLAFTPLTPTLARSATAKEELAVYNKHPELLKGTFDHVTENIRATIELLDQQQITDGRDELERLLVEVPVGVSSSLRDDFERLEAIREQFSTIMRGRGVGEKLLDTGTLNDSTLNDAVAALPDTIRNHALFCQQAVAGVSGAPKAKPRFLISEDVLGTIGVIGMIGGIAGVLIACSFYFNAPCVPD